MSHYIFEFFPFTHLKLLHYKPHIFCESCNKFLSYCNGCLSEHPIVLYHTNQLLHFYMKVSDTLPKFRRKCTQKQNSNILFFPQKYYQTRWHNAAASGCQGGTGTYNLIDLVMLEFKIRSLIGCCCYIIDILSGSHELLRV